MAKPQASLLQRAQAVRSKRSILTATPQELELVYAMINDQVTPTQVTKALGKSTKQPSNIYSWSFLRLRAAIRAGQVTLQINGKGPRRRPA